MSRERKRGNVRSLQQRGHRVRPSCSPRTPLLMSPLSPTGAATSALLPHRPVRPCGPARRHHSAGRPEGVSPFDTISQRSTSGDDEGSIGSTTCSTWPSRPSGFTDFPSPTCSPRSSGWEWGSSSNRSHRSAVHIARRQTRTRFACEYDGAPEPGDLVAPGSATQFKYVNFLDALHRD